MNGPLREFEPLLNLLHTIPNKVQKAFRSHSIDWTALDATKHYIAVGSNAGVVFLYCRDDQGLQRLECKNHNEQVSCIRICESVDHLVAMGTASGHVCIFQLPSILPGRNKQLHRYEVLNSHHSRITALHWSQNGMKMYSGDEDGIVYCTELDYEKQTSRTYFVHKDAHEIVQLDYGSRMLLISTRFRTLVHNITDNTQKQVGTKDRKLLGQFGAVFLPGSYQPPDKVLFATRPGYRLWKASADGKVNATYIYKDLLKAPHEGIELLGDSLHGCSIHSASGEDAQFGRLLMYQETQLVSYNDSCIYVMDPGLGNFVGYYNNIGKILNVAVCDDEIFILRKDGSRKILRIAQTPDYSSRPRSSSTQSSGTVGAISDKVAAQRPVELMTQTASTFLSAFVDMSDRLRSNIQEGQSAKPPPWGSVGQQPSVEEGEELNPSESTSPDVSASTEEACQSVDEQAKQIDQASKQDGEDLDEKNSDDPTNFDQASADQRTVGFVMRAEDDFSILNSKDVLRKTDHSMISYTAPGGPKGVEKAEIQHPGAPPLMDDGDLVIRVKTKKKAKKKKNKDKDAGSISSFDMQGSIHSEDSQPIMDDCSNQGVPQEDKVNVTNTDRDSSLNDQMVVGSKPSDPPLSDDTLKSSLLEDSHKSIDHKQESQIVDHKEETIASKILKQNIEKNTEKVKHHSSENSYKKGEMHDEKKRTHSFGNVNRDSKPDTENCKLNEKVDNALTCTEQSNIQLGSNQSKSECVHGHHPVPQELEITESSIKKEDKVNPLAKEREKPAALSSSPPISYTDTPAFSMFAKAFGKPLPEQSTTGSALSNRSTSGVTDNNAELRAIEKPSGISMQTKFDELEKKQPEKTAQLEINTKDKYDSPSHSEQSNLSPKESDSEDFYSVYAGPYSQIKSPVSPLSIPSDSSGFGMTQKKDVLEERNSLDDAMDYERAIQRSESLNSEQEIADEGGLASVMMTNMWNEFTVAGNLQCVCVTSKHVWIVDKSERLYYSHLSGPGLKWHKIEVPAQKISVSPSGYIVWRMHRGTLYAGTKITTRAPAGLKWEDFVESGVADISVDETMGWYVKTNGELIMHKNLTRERPCYTPQKVECDQSLVKVACHKSVVWVLTEDRSLIVRMGIKKGQEEGDGWHYLGSGGPSQLVAGFDLGEEDTVWVIDVVGRLWFMTGVTANRPQGDGQWWQVSLTEYLMHDATALGILKTISDYPQKLFQYVQQSDGGGLVSARCNGVWACASQKNVLHVCKGGMLGHRWETLSLPGIAPMVTWKHVSASGLMQSEGYIWAQQPNGGIFCFDPQRAARVLEVSSPEPESGIPAQCISVGRDVVWLLMPKGKVYLRGGIHSSCPQGVKWIDLDLTQLGRRVYFIWLSCGDENVWAVDNKGRVHLRIGIQPPTSRHLNPAWVPVDGMPQTAGAKFVKVFTGPKDWMVWALDSQGYVYVRKGITDNMPVGSHWVYVQGSTASDLVVSESSVYALTANGEILLRCGITEENVMGNCWTKIPGVLSSLSAAHEGDSLWGINKDGQLCSRQTHYLNKKMVLHKLHSKQPESVEGGWELL